MIGLYVTITYNNQTRSAWLASEATAVAWVAESLTTLMTQYGMEPHTNIRINIDK